MSTLPIGLTLHNGPSRIDGKPAIAIATGIGRATKNRKTGAAIQIWILRADVDPIEAIQTGADRSICGDCKLRDGRLCYVNVTQAPLAIWKAYKRGAYPIFKPRDHARLFADRVVRLGAYGDQAAIPIPVWRALERCKPARILGYTHQWKARRFRYVGRYCMASVDNERERFEARALGYRTFRVRLPEEPIGEGEIVCPAAPEHTGAKITCEACQLCAGNARAGKRDIAIVVHGRKGVASGLRKARGLVQVQIGEPMTSHARRTLALWNSLTS